MKIKLDKHGNTLSDLIWTVAVWAVVMFILFNAWTN